MFEKETMNFEAPNTLVVDNGEPNLFKRKYNIEKEEIRKGIEVRDNICLSLSECNLRRKNDKLQKKRPLGMETSSGLS